jgi:arylsulfatase A-like enzyme
VPTGNIDLAPTALAMLGLPVPDTMDGRVLEEALVDGPEPAAVEVRTREDTAETAWDGGSYRLIVRTSFVGGTAYIDLARVRRRQATVYGVAGSTPATRPP